jgi:hypothetical protein
MTVSELIAALQQFPGDRPVVISGYEGGLEDVGLVQSCAMRRNVNRMRYVGPHQEVDEGSRDAVAGVHLMEAI